MNTRTIPAQISAFQALLLAAHPTATIELDEPGDANGTWMIDLRIGKLFLPTEWSHERGFGIFTTLDLGFGERPNERHHSAETAAARVRQITRDLMAGHSAGLTLAGLRDLLGLNQTELAAKLGVGQAAVSKLESRSQAQVGTLQRAVEKLGGQLVMTVRFPGFDAEFELPEGDPKQVKSRSSQQAVTRARKRLTLFRDQKAAIAYTQVINDLVGTAAEAKRKTAAKTAAPQKVTKTEGAKKVSSRAPTAPKP
jgi:transcriptional regulator with XRE-family HTH domain